MILLFKNLLFTLVVPGTVAVYLPLRIAHDRSFATGPAFGAGCLLLVAGVSLYAWCVWDFATFGRGTPAPIDAPKKLVVRGLYRCLRNPMYTGVLTVILAWAVLFRAVELLIYALVVGTCFQLFVVFYEEPHLRAEFGSEYEGYCRRVGRWLPRLRRRAASALFVLFVSSTATQSVTPESPTPPAPAEGGPVYPDDKDVGGGARDVPWSTTIADSSEPGERLILTGLVFTAAGKAREGVTVYAYHTDAKGLYRGKPWGRPRLRGWARTNAEGRYEFHTIRPAPYPNRRNPAHIHMTIAVPGEVEWWIPELRFANDAFLGREDIAREAQRGTFASIRPLERQADGSLRCVRDIRLPQGW